MDDEGRNDPRRTGRDPSASGYHASGALGQRDGRRVAVVIALIVVGIGFSAFLAAFVGAPAASTPPLVDAATSRPSAGDPHKPDPTVWPLIARFGASGQTRPVPFDAGRIQWMDPATGLTGGQGEPPGLVSNRTFVDGQGRAVSLCLEQKDERDLRRTTIRLCLRDEYGAIAGDPIVAAELVSPNVLHPAYDLGGPPPIALDATVSRDGRWLWLISTVRTEHWEVAATRIDLATRRANGYRILREIPIDGLTGGTPEIHGWLVPREAIVEPVVRASPDGARLSVTLDARSVTGVVFQRERIVVEASLDAATDVEVAFPVLGASDAACTSGAAAWATDAHFLTLCAHAESNGKTQAFIRVEDPNDMTRDIAIGPSLAPAIGGESPVSADSAWLLNGARGLLYRWVPSSRTLTMIDVATRAGTTLTIDGSGSPAAAPWPTADDAEAGAWSPLTTRPDGTSDGRLVGRSDGRVIYLLGSSSQGPVSNPTPTAPSIWAVDASTLRILARWSAPAPVDQMVLSPGDEALVMIETPRALVTAPVGPGPVADWNTSAWFVDARTGAPIEVLGQLRGPGFATLALLQPSAAAFAGF